MFEQRMFEQKMFEQRMNLGSDICSDITYIGGLEPTHCTVLFALSAVEMSMWQKVRKFFRSTKKLLPLTDCRRRQQKGNRARGAERAYEQKESTYLTKHESIC